eukprot:g15329.t2
MEELFEQLQDDTRSFWQSPSAGVRRLDSMPSSSDFFRDYVATSTPVVISGGASACLKASRGSWDDLPSLARRGGANDLEVTVNFTPDGRGDCVVDVPCGMLSRHPVNNGGSSNNRPGDAASGVSTKEEASSDDSGMNGGTVAKGAVVGKPSPSPAPAPAPAAAAPEAKASREVGDTAVFVKPEERMMKFETFLDMLLGEGGNDNPFVSGASKGGGQGVPYLSHQNDSLRQEFPGLMEDVEPFLALAGEAFGNEPDAVNLWIGDDRSVSAVHKDHYENMYCVVRGEKLFTLLPPSDVLFLYEQDYASGTYRQRRGKTGELGGFEVELDRGATVPWIPVDPACPDLEKYPLFRYASPVQCRVGPGHLSVQREARDDGKNRRCSRSLVEIRNLGFGSRTPVAATLLIIAVDILYLPALWYHRVAQKGVTIAVNYWHDMQFDHKYVYYRFLQTLAAAKCRNCLLPPPSRLPTGGGTVSAVGERSSASPVRTAVAVVGVEGAVREEEGDLGTKSSVR